MGHAACMPAEFGREARCERIAHFASSWHRLACFATPSARQGSPKSGALAHVPLEPTSSERIAPQHQPRRRLCRLRLVHDACSTPSDQSASSSSTAAHVYRSLAGFMFAGKSSRISAACTSTWSPMTHSSPRSFAEKSCPVCLGSRKLSYAKCRLFLLTDIPRCFSEFLITSSVQHRHLKPIQCAAWTSEIRWHWTICRPTDHKVSQIPHSAARYPDRGLSPARA
jgi:hypothetical protein